MADEQHVPVGIDLGTTFSAVAFVDAQGRPTTIENSEGETTTPSVVFFDRDGVIIGTEAEVAGETEPERIARLAKRDMGGERYSRKILEHELRPEVIQSLVLHRIRQDAALRIGDFKKAVITVPAYFNEPRRKATQDAGKIAGLDVIDIINEPTAAALAYGVQHGFLNEQGTASQDETVLVYDLGGGTFDVTLMRIEGNQFTAIATAGDVFLGGVDWDRALFDFAAEQFKSEFQIDCCGDAVLEEKLMRECTRAKKSLSARSETIIRMEAGGQRFKIDLTRKKFEELTRHLLERTRLTTDRLLSEAKVGWKDLTKLLLVGGSTRMPMVGNLLEKESGLKVDRSISPDEAVAHGAAIYAGILLKHGPTAGAGISVANVNSHDLGVLGTDPKSGKPRRQVIIPRNQRLPADRKKKFQTSKEGQSRVIVQIVEGGTDTGQGATHIGKCVVDQLPENLPRGTEVIVGFRYSQAGRLEVTASLPKLEREAATTINRSRGMDESEIANWQAIVHSGFQLGKTATHAVVSTDDVVEDVSVVEEVSVDKVGAGSLDELSSSKEMEAELDDKTKDVAKRAVDKVSSAASSQSFPDFGDELPSLDHSATLSKVRIDDADQPEPHSVDVDRDVLNELVLSEENAKTLAGESMLDFLEDDSENKKASASDTSLNDFLKGLN